MLKKIAIGALIFLAGGVFLLQIAFGGTLYGEQTDSSGLFQNAITRSPYPLGYPTATQSSGDPWLVMDVASLTGACQPHQWAAMFDSYYTTEILDKNGAVVWTSTSSAALAADYTGLLFFKWDGSTFRWDTATNYTIYLGCLGNVEKMTMRMDASNTTAWYIMTDAPEEPVPPIGVSFSFPVQSTSTGDFPFWNLLLENSTTTDSFWFEVQYGH